MGNYTKPFKDLTNTTPLSRVARQSEISSYVKNIINTSHVDFHQSEAFEVSEVILDNVRDCLEKNLNFFSTMDKNEILNHRKNKFLSIGRNKGFTVQSSLSENLSMKENVIDKFKLKFIKDKKNIYFIILFLVLVIGSLFLL